MTSVTGTPETRFHLLRKAPMAGEIGHPGTCPLCAHVQAAPPCLACRDEMRARLAEFHAHDATDYALN